MIDTALANYLTYQIQNATKLHPSYGELWQHVRDMIMSGGKRLRPKLCMWAYQAYGGQEEPAMMNLAVAWELLHTGLLIHDDIMDHDLERRGRPTIEAIYGDRNVAILAGDMCLGAAYDLGGRALSEAGFEVIGGQLLDIGVGEADPLTIARLKTASYSFVGPLVSGAMLAGASAIERHGLKQIGINLGVAFQLQNDLKDLAEDRREGKASAVIQAVEDLGSEAEGREAIERIIETHQQRALQETHTLHIAEESLAKLITFLA